MTENEEKEDREEKKSASLCERNRKTTEAIYRVTELFSDKEPLKWALRSSAIDIFNYLFSIDSGTISASDFETISNSINRIIKTLELASFSVSLLSSVNFEILRREYILFTELVENKKQEMLRPKILLPAFNGHSPTSEFDSNGLSVFSNGHVNYKGHIGQEEPNANIEISKEIKPNNINSDLKSGGINANDFKNFKERERKIIDFIKDNDWIGIHDIFSALPQFSGKSIQRDILGLVKMGILKKTGDKRWRKYSLNNDKNNLTVQ